MHGGDIYRNNVKYDFSVNLNPLGMPSEVRWVLTEAALHANKYPDIIHEQLKQQTSDIFSCSKDIIVYGNGASELLMAICHAYMPKKALMIAPSFSGYKSAIKGAAPKCRIIYHYLSDENDFVVYHSIIEKLIVEKPQIFFLTNPNNPNGMLLDKQLLDEIIDTCDRIGTLAVVDECFLPLTGKEKEYSLAYDVTRYKSLIVLRAFTKTFAMPGVRLGYMLCSKRNIAQTVESHLPEWNLSIFAQMAGAECLKHLDSIDEAVRLIETERGYLMEGMRRLGIVVFHSDANYILFRCERNDLVEALLEYGILIRDCSDYDGLEEGYYRIAIRQHNENSGLLSALEDLI